jgi:CRP-like cAMP-binding protein
MASGRKKSHCLNEFWTGRADCKHCFPNTPVAFGKLESRQNDAPFRLIQEYHVDSGVVIVSAGDPASAVYTIRDGFLKVWRTDDRGREHILRILRPGDMLGLETLAQPRHTSSASSLTSASLCEIPIAVLEHVRSREPELDHELDSRWNRQLQYTETLMSEVAVGDARAKIVNLLQYVSELAAPYPCPHISRSDMATMVGISSASAARVIADLKKHSLFEESREEMRFDPGRISEILHQV